MKQKQWFSLNGFLGVYGITTSKLLSNQDYYTCAAALWPDAVRGTQTLEDIQRAVKAMPKAVRKRQALENIAQVPSCFLSQADRHEKALASALMSRSTRSPEGIEA